MKRINFDLPDYVVDILSVLHSNSYEAYIVGGSVRDLVMKNCPHDYDITTNALPEQVITLFKDKHNVIETGIKHGTVTVMCGANPVEITTYRVDGAYIDCRRPEAVTFTRSLYDDLSRRDFTINALAYNKADGVIDCYNGISDIKSKIVRCIGNPIERFTEDALRILRALRFAVKLDFDIETKTSEAIFAMKKTLKYISAERVFSELGTMFSYDNKKRLSCILKDYKDIFEGVLDISVSNEKYLIVCDDIINVPTEHILGLIYYICRISCDEISVRRNLSALKVSNEFANKTVAIFNILNSYTNTTNVAVVKKLMCDYGVDNCKKAASILSSVGHNHNFSEQVNRIIQEDQCYSLKQLAVSGDDIMRAFPVSGKTVGAILNKLLTAVINEETVNEKSALLNFAKTIHDTVEK